MLRFLELPPLIGGLALLAAGCGGHSGAPQVASLGGGSTISTSGAVPPGTQRLRPATAAMAAASLKATRCMRSHGFPNFPDPYMGHFGWSVDSGLPTNSPRFKVADAYCAKRYIPYPPITPAEKARLRAAALKVARCMRAHGASDLPDPDATGSIDFPTADYYRSPNVLRAKSACASLITGTGVTFDSPAP